MKRGDFLKGLAGVAGALFGAKAVPAAEPTKAEAPEPVGIAPHVGPFVYDPNACVTAVATVRFVTGGPWDEAMPHAYGRRGGRGRSRGHLRGDGV